MLLMSILSKYLAWDRNISDWKFNQFSESKQNYLSCISLWEIPWGAGRSLDFRESTAVSSCSDSSCRLSVTDNEKAATLTVGKTSNDLKSLNTTLNTTHACFAGNLIIQMPHCG